MSGDFFARTAIWIIALALWVSLNQANDVGLLPMWAGVPSVLGCALTTITAAAFRDGFRADRQTETRRYAVCVVRVGCGSIIIG
jgi:hypothetical protein